MNKITSVVRRLVRTLARIINNLSGGKLTPNTITGMGLIAHIPIAWFIYQQDLVLAAALLIVFGLFDTLDGELARLQKRASPMGMILDSVSDRIKEVFIYCGIGAFFNATGTTNMTVFVIGALGTSLCISYVNAWGDAVLAAHNINAHETNKIFRSGLLRFEIRMSLIIAGLLLNQLDAVIYIIFIGAIITILQRLANVRNNLEHV